MKLKALLLLLAFCAVSPARAEPVTVFAAASLTDALTEIGEMLEEQGLEVRFSFAASSTLARQIEAGAPADLFFSANELWMDHLEAQSLISAPSRVSPIGNRLVLVGSNEWLGETLNEDQLAPAFLEMRGPLVMGDPAHVPAGLYTQQALENMGLWENEGIIFAFADNVRAALALVERGEADFGVVYATDSSFSDRVTTVFSFAATSHDPITYPLALLTQANSPEAQRVYDLLLSAEALGIFHKHGFTVPE